MKYYCCQVILSRCTACVCRLGGVAKVDTPAGRVAACPEGALLGLGQPVLRLVVAILALAVLSAVHTRLHKPCVSHRDRLHVTNPSSGVSCVANSAEQHLSRQGGLGSHAHALLCHADDEVRTLEKRYLEAFAVLLLAVRLLAVAAPLVLADDALRRLHLLDNFGVKRLQGANDRLSHPSRHSTQLSPSAGRTGNRM